MNIIHERVFVNFAFVRTSVTRPPSRGFIGSKFTIATPMQTIITKLIKIIKNSQTCSKIGFFIT